MRLVHRDKAMSRESSYPSEVLSTLLEVLAVLLGVLWWLNSIAFSRAISRLQSRKEPGVGERTFVWFSIIAILAVSLLLCVLGAVALYLNGFLALPLLLLVLPLYLFRVFEIGRKDFTFRRYPSEVE